MASSSQDISAKYTSHLRNQAPSKFKCDICTTAPTFQTESSWWKHYTESHAGLLFGLDDKAQAALREARKEACRIERVNPLNTQAAHSSDVKGDADQWVNFTVHTIPSPNNPGIAGQLEGLKIQPELPQEDPFDADVEMPDRPSSPIHDNNRVATLHHPSSPLRQPRHMQSAAEKRTRTGRARGAASGRRSRREPFDSDFDRSLPNEPIPEDGTKATRRLFDPARDTVASFKAAEDTAKRLEIAAGPPLQSSRGVGRSRKENKKKEQNSRSQPLGVTPSVELQPRSLQPSAQLYSNLQSDVAQGSREGGRLHILKNHNQLHYSQRPQAPQLFDDQPPPEDEERLRIVRQPETRPISGEQLTSEVKGIYAGLMMVEGKCIEVDQLQAALAKQVGADPQKQHKLNDDQWRALIALHRTLLHEHHDFFLASQHPSATPALRRLASKHNMPARMWKYGIYSFLELLRQRLPHSLEHMITFIYLAYSIVALLYETVPAFEDTWIECLGDLGRYRMAIEDDDIRDREVWTNVATIWYSKAADKMPTVGRLYHHLAILSRPHMLQQLFFYCKSLTVSNPFSHARESILALFEPIFASSPNGNIKGTTVDMMLITLHGICFTRIDFNKFDDALDEFLGLLDTHIEKAASRWKVQGCYIAVCNIAALYEYGARGGKLRQTIRDSKQSVKEQVMEDITRSTVSESADFETLLSPLSQTSSKHVTPLLSSTSKLPKEATLAAVATTVKSDQSGEASELYFGYAKRLAFSTLDLVLQRDEDHNIHPHIHAWLAFMCFLIKTATAAIHLLENDFPWDSLVSYLNTLIQEIGSKKYEHEAFPTPDKGIGRPLPEDWTLRGLEWTKGYFAEGWIENAPVDDEERLLELPSMAATRAERILWLAVRICNGGDWLVYNSNTQKFSVNPVLIQRIEQKKKAEAVSREANLGVKNDSDGDIEMETSNHQEEEIYDIDNVSEEMKQLVACRQQLWSELKTDKSLEEDDLAFEEIRRVSAKQCLKANYTVLVVDTNLLLSSLDIFKAMLKTDEWSIVIPNTVVTELLGISNNQGTVGEFAKAAMAAIQDAVASKKDVRVITAKGNNVTNVCFFKEKLDKFNEDDMNIDDVIISITEMQAKLRTETKRAEGFNAGQAQGAILITEDRNMRVKANARGVPAIAGSALRTILSLGDTARPWQKRKSFVKAPFTNPLIANFKQKFPDIPEETLAATLQDANDDLETAIYNISQSRLVGPPRPQSPNFKKRHKREKDIVEGSEEG